MLIALMHQKLERKRKREKFFGSQDQWFKLAVKLCTEWKCFLDIDAFAIQPRKF